MLGFGRRLRLDFLLVSGATGLAAAFGALRLKIVASSLGATGLGGVSILLNAMWTLAIVLGLGLGTSATARLAAARADGDRLSEVDAALRFATRGLAIVGGAISGLLWILLAPDDPMFPAPVSGTILGISVSAIILSNRLLAWLAADQRILALATVQISSAIAATAALVVLRNEGAIAILCCAVMGSPLGLLAAAMLCKPVRLRAARRPEVSVELVRKDLAWMSKTGAASSLSPLLLNLTQLAASLWLAHKFSIVAAGHFQASAAVATAGLTVVLAALNALYLPRLTSVSEHVGSLVSAELSKIALAVGFAGATLAIAASPVLTLLYTSEFAQVSTTFRWFMLGMALKAIAWVVAYPLLARGKSAPFAIIEVSWACAYLVVLTVLSPLSVAAPGIAYAVAGLLSLVQGAVVTRLRPSVRSLFMVLVVTATLLLLALEG